MTAERGNTGEMISNESTEQRSPIRKPTCVLVLAAGESSRYGYFPKQLLKFEGRSLIRRAIETALASNASHVSVVLGANAERILPEIDGLPVRVVVNDRWASGIGSSIRVAINDAIERTRELRSIAITLADQPLVGAQSINALFDAAGTDRIAAAEYGGIVGVPAVFTRPFFSELLAIGPTEGAKKLILAHRERTRSIPIPEAAFDIDRPADLENLTSEI